MADGPPTCWQPPPAMVWLKRDRIILQPSMALWHLDGAIAPQHLRLSGEAALLRRTYDDDDDDENLEERPSTNAQNSRPFVPTSSSVFAAVVHFCNEKPVLLSELNLKKGEKKTLVNSVPSSSIQRCFDFDHS
ncbi:hypothetical protein V9T40_013867 [Parthenolecanium corni]|uniref:Uncharacterized protein n=1 Tax=Parthenolecanium corni TaxID=536013 RepID=A0AAN9TDK2_9HEMI